MNVIIIFLLSYLEDNVEEKLRILHILYDFLRKFLSKLIIFLSISLQTQLSHGFPVAYSDRRGSDYSAALSGSGSVGRLGSGGDHDPLSLHQALQEHEQEQNQVCDEAATTFMTDLPLLKSELNCNIISVLCVVYGLGLYIQQWYVCQVRKERKKGDDDI